MLKPTQKYKGIIKLPKKAEYKLKELVKNPNNPLGHILKEVQAAASLDYSKDWVNLMITVAEYAFQESKQFRWVRDTHVLRECNSAIERITGLKYLPDALIGKLIWKYCKERGLMMSPLMIVVTPELQPIFGDVERVNPLKFNYPGKLIAPGEVISF
eukprot:NODE_438_length_7412_cov_0.582798.p7 type:complete len:157 gc:universal NODE_438_length_7412_cov_0.582798:2653-2183(-)